MAKLAEYGEWQRYFNAPHKVTIECKDRMELVNMLMGEGNSIY